MDGEGLSAEEMGRVCEHVGSHAMTLAIIRTCEAPSELGGIFGRIASECGLPLVRNLSSPASDFGFAEFNSNGKMLVMLYIGGQHTELVSVSETDEIVVRDLEDSVFSSNIQSSIIRDGL
jgi:hypothetical protein